MALAPQTGTATSKTNYTPLEWNNFTADKPAIAQHHLSPQPMRGFSVVGVHSSGFDQCTMTCFHQYGTTQGVFTVFIVDN